MRWLVWFSCGAASAVAAKLAIEKYGDECEVVCCDTRASEHPDNYRFFDDVERWLGRKIVLIQSDKYVTVDDVYERRRYMSGPKGAICTTELKKVPRVKYQRPDDVHIFGYTAEERQRADDFEDRNPELRCEWILIDQWVRKQDCHDIIKAAGIARPAMYVLGFEHNNCPGCVKSKSPGYWNRIRRHFPETFARRVHQSRLLGVRLVELHGQRIFLDELPSDSDTPDDNIDCGPVCQMPLNFGDAA